MIWIYIDDNDIVARNIFLELKNKLDLSSEVQDSYTIYRSKEFSIINSTINNLKADYVEELLKKEEVECLVFPSIHKSEKNIKSLTVHTTGNFSHNPFGGMSYKLSIASPIQMRKALVYMNNHKIEGYNVSYEATHHGPTIDVPLFFIESGSTEKEWNDIKAHQIILGAILNLKKDTDDNECKVSIGIGGGHYAPRFTDYAIKKNICYGHIMPQFRYQEFTDTIGREMIKKTPKAQFVSYHGNVPDKIKKYFEGKLTTL
jgi:D-aminoacyl-tRNA deacylase